MLLSCNMNTFPYWLKIFLVVPTRQRPVIDRCLRFQNILSKDLLLFVYYDPTEWYDIFLPMG